MPPKVKFTKEQVFDAAFRIIRERGWQALTARAVAQSLNSSTMPIYSYFKSMAEIESEMRIRISGVMFEYQTAAYTDNKYINLAIGYVVFADKEKNLFRFISVERPAQASPFKMEQMNKRLSELLGEPASASMFLGSFSTSQLNGLMLKSWIFTHGLAMLVSSGALVGVDEKEIARLVTEQGAALYLWEQQPKEGKQS